MSNDSGEDEVNPQWLRHLIVLAVEARDKAAAAGNWELADRIQAEIEDLIEQYEEATGMTVTESGEEVPMKTEGVVDAFTETGREVLERRGIPTESLSRVEAEQLAEEWRAVDEAEAAAERNEVERLEVERITGVDTSRLSSDEVAEIVEANQDKFAAETVRANQNWEDFKEHLPDAILNELEGRPGTTTIPDRLADRATFLSGDDPRDPANAPGPAVDSRIPTRPLPGNQPQVPGTQGRTLPEMPDEGSQSQDPMNPREAVVRRPLPGTSASSPGDSGGDTGGSNGDGTAATPPRSAAVDDSPPSPFPVAPGVSGGGSNATGNEQPATAPDKSGDSVEVATYEDGGHTPTDGPYVGTGGKWYDKDGNEVSGDKAAELTERHGPPPGSASSQASGAAGGVAGSGTKNAGATAGSTTATESIEYTPSGEGTGGPDTGSTDAVREHAEFVKSILEAARGNSEVNPTRGDSLAGIVDLEKFDELKPADPPDDFVEMGDPASPGPNYADSHGAGTIRPGPDAEGPAPAPGPYDDIPTSVGPGNGPVNLPGTNDGDTAQGPSGITRTLIETAGAHRNQPPRVTDIQATVPFEPAPMAALGPTQAEWEAQQAESEETNAEVSETTLVSIPGVSSFSGRGATTDEGANRSLEDEDLDDESRWSPDE